MSKSTDSMPRIVLRLLETNGTIRQSKLIESTSTATGVAWETIDRLVIQGKIKRFPVGNHIMLKPNGSLGSSDLTPFVLSKGSNIGTTG